ncbi:Delta(14)-sterol reductase [Ascobolus immersus RN42]|uniref:Delta(14)-sterol reductase n=2 Tax=Ascobolus immersus TaxID=5191 RepID=ERG24_ASCIM|nr:RecName: Full=Delta(14)-sterol reductase; AltName: Full=C-14 sterol reductase; AltName: Full=Sterol C14-reductase [Ascobolus immersus]RPA74245.1 Delta(14)-sterol reductase [Ascobolus immersus RN42]CAA71650.1 sterol C-14 reductase [Ascobolus immersus]
MGGKDYEFGGPIGTGVLMLILPPISHYLHFLITPRGAPPPEFWSAPLETLKSVTPTFSSLFSLHATLAVAAYYLLLVALMYVLPAEIAEGVVLKDGSRLKYRCNAFTTFLVFFTFLGTMTVLEGPTWWFWSYLTDNFAQLQSASIVFSYAMSLWVYIRSYRPMPKGKEVILSPVGFKGNHIHDFWMGRELNPRIGEWLDIKQLHELRPGLMGWILFNLAWTVKQYNTHGFVSDSIVLVNLFETWYVVDALWNESKVLTTMDITTDGLGVMLLFGNAVWVPFMYCLQARYLASFPVHLGLLGIAGVLAVQFTGYAIFRGANNQKNAFRTNPADPAVSHLKFMTTKSGSKLLISGWWGVARHVNYFGDWIMAWSYCLTTGFNTPLTYFYVIYFGILLLHRDRRDEAKCREKYGKDWDRYCKVVKWRIIPGIY